MDNFSYKTVLITGGTSGIGFAVAKRCIDNHYRVIIVGSSEERSIPAKNEINAKHPNADVVFFYADLSVQKNIHRLCHEINEYLEDKCQGRLDVLINNAGGVRDFFHLTEDQVEFQFALNHLSGVLIANLLLDKLHNGTIIFTGSYSHKNTKIHWDDLMFSKNYFIFTAYRQTKLANLMTAMAFNEVLKPYHIQSYVVDPGLVNTQIANKHTSLLVKLVWWFKRKKGTDPSVPAKTYLYLIQNRPRNGVYFKDCQLHSYNPIADNLDQCIRLLKVSESLCHINFDINNK